MACREKGIDFGNERPMERRGARKRHTPDRLGAKERRKRGRPGAVAERPKRAQDREFLKRRERGALRMLPREKGERVLNYRKKFVVPLLTGEKPPQERKEARAKRRLFARERGRPRRGHGAGYPPDLPSPQK